jgi:hypothetical protein
MEIWQRSDIWSQASYRYPISWEAFFDPSDSYFLFAKERGYHRWALAHSSSCYDFKVPFIIYAIITQEVGIWRVKKCFPWYGVPIWSLWPNIRSLSSIVAEKNATKNEHICPMCRKINKVGKQEVGIWRVKKCFPWYGVPIWSLLAMPYCGKRFWTHQIPTSCLPT